MTKQQALKVLKRFQEWRRYNGPSLSDLADCGMLSELDDPTTPEPPTMPHPKEIGEALDVVIALLTEEPNPR